MAVMEHLRVVEIVREAVAAARLAETPLFGETKAIPVAHYTNASRLALERTRLFHSLPIPIAHVAELAGPKNVAVRTVDGVSIVLTRSDDGVVRGFRNSCRHRGVRLVSEDCRAKGLVCPYHGWTYGLSGELRHIPHPQAFPTCDRANHGLVPVRLEERHGLIWASLDDGAPGVEAHLGGIDDELAALGLSTHAVGGRVVTEQRGNWKMLMDAFLEGYHIRHLHRNSVYPFFLDCRSAAQRVGLHIRTASARRTAREVAPEQLDAAALIRKIATVSYMIFPATTLVLHPDWTSVVSVQPLATDRFLFSHTQLIPEEPRTDDERAHFARSFALINGGVFHGEDLLMCAEMQAGFETGANATLNFGLLESPALWLHEGIAAILGDGVVCEPV
jgi:phenylpropionate dioxygenase-like ring-hydroxylating dioxygenase large terminal subunit